MMTRKRRVEILKHFETQQQTFFKIEEAHLKHELQTGGMSAPIIRYNLERPDGVAALVHDVEQNTVVLVEQFRFSTYAKGSGWLLEVPAGVVEPGEQGDLSGALRRELREEIGYDVDDLQPIYTFYLSPGISSERTILYYVPVTAVDQVSSGGGISEEGEDLAVIRLPVATAFARLDSGEIEDARTIIALEWLRRQKYSST